MKMFLCLVLIGCASAAVASTLDLPAEAWFSDAPGVVANKLANLCADRSSMVTEQDEHHVLCEREISGMKGALAQALLGNAYSTWPVIHVRFSIITNGTAVRVIASEWVEVQMAMGQIRRTPMDGKKEKANLRSLLFSIGGKSDVPTTSAGSPSPNAPPTDDSDKLNKLNKSVQ